MARGIASVGECMLELSADPDGRWRLGYAGDTFNTLWTLRALSGDETPVDYVSAFGTDPFSARQTAFFAENGIGMAASPVIEGARPGMYAITLDGAERSFTYWRADAAARQLAHDRNALAKSLEDRALVYFSGITLAILDGPSRTSLLDALSEARANGATIGFDPNFRPALWADRDAARHAFTRAIRVADIVLPTFPDEQALFGDATTEVTASRIADAGALEVVVKDGEAPALLAVDGGLEAIPAVSVARPLDTTGAGDSFNGGYLAARVLGLPPRQAVERAHRVAAEVIQVRGALAPFESIRRAFSG